MRSVVHLPCVFHVVKSQREAGDKVLYDRKKFFLSVHSFIYPKGSKGQLEKSEGQIEESEGQPEESKGLPEE